VSAIFLSASAMPQKGSAHTIRVSPIIASPAELTLCFSVKMGRWFEAKKQE
jgi:hypothetical protein